jgi:hypothetical protein
VIAWSEIATGGEARKAAGYGQERLDASAGPSRMTFSAAPPKSAVISVICALAAPARWRAGK